MKRILFFLVLAVLFSCKDSNKKNENPNPLISEEAVEMVEETVEESETEIGPVEISLEEFPKRWYMLLGEDGEFVIFKYCYAELQQVWVDQTEDGGWEVSVLYGQDSQEFRVVDFEATEETQEQFRVVSGQFILQNPYQPDMDPEIYEFWWNKDRMFGFFSGFFNEDAYMVSEGNKDNYEVVVEECDYDE